jgi:hypothetical protein
MGVDNADLSLLIAPSVMLPSGTATNITGLSQCYTVHSVVELVHQVIIL